MPLSHPLVTVEELVSLLNAGTVVVADCRGGTPDDQDAGRRAYDQAHIPGAVYFHLEHDLSGPEGEHGGRHPLPDPAMLAAKLSAAGLGPGVPLVVYDETGAHAARFWWLMQWLGHDQVAVLDGGWRAWAAAGQPTTDVVPGPLAGAFEPRVNWDLVVSMAGVQNRPADQVVVDARSGARYAGQPDPLDARQGHIPGAVNRFWGDGLRPDGTWRSPEEQRARFAALPPGEQLIHSCGSGVTACANLLAMALAGLPGGRLYVGSWSDWCSYPDNPVEL